MENLYEILEVSSKASKEVIEKAYKVLAKRYHPDVAKDKIKADQMIKKINNAYSILSDNKKRQEYDIQLLSSQDLKEVNYNVQHTNYNRQINNVQYNEPVKTINIDNRILILLIIVALVLFIFSCISLFGTFGEIINNTNDTNGNKTEYINDDTSKYVLEDIVFNLTTFNLDEISKKIINTQLFKADEVKIIKDNIDIYNQMLSHISISVKEVKATNERAELVVNITRNDVENIYIQYYFARGLGLKELTPEQERELLLKSIEDNTKEVTLTDKFIAKKIDNQWKFELTNTNMIYLIGMSISKYVNIFELIN